MKPSMAAKAPSTPAQHVHLKLELKESMRTREMKRMYLYNIIWPSTNVPTFIEIYHNMTKERLWIPTLGSDASPRILATAIKVLPLLLTAVGMVNRC